MVEPENAPALIESIRAGQVVDRESAIPTPPKAAIDAALSRFDHFRNASGGTPTAELRLEMQKTMQSVAAVFRTLSGLFAGARDTDEADIEPPHRAQIGSGGLIERNQHRHPVTVCSPVSHQ